MSSDEARKRAEKNFKQEERAQDARTAMAEYEAQVLATREKTARLKALRLAKEAQALAIHEKAARLTALRLAKKIQAHTDEPAQTPARENPRRDNNRDRRKDK